MTMLTRRAALATTAVALATPTILRAQPAPVKLGILQPVTGALAQDGDLGRAGAQIAIDEVNKSGGLKGLGGAKIEMVFGDAQSTPDGGVAQVERMQSEGVAAIVGGFASPICLAASQAASRYGLPYVVDVGVADSIVNRGLTNTFRFAPGFGKVSSTALANLVKLNEAAGNPVKTVVLVHEDGLFGSGTAKLLQAELPKLGFQILETISHPTPARDMSNIALRIRSLNPDMIIPSDYYGESVLLARTLQQQRIKPKAIYGILNGAASNYRFVKEFPDAAEGMLDCNHWADPRNPKTAIVRKQTEAMGKIWAYNVMLNYSCVLLALDAMDRAGSTDKDKVTAALAASTFSGHIMPYGPTKFENGQNTGAAPVNTQVQSGDIKVIYPDAFADAKPHFPVT
jgi:branched-chain amino acid transport system substrate-binding protein